MTKGKFLTACLFAGAALLVFSSLGFAQSSFFAGKTVTLIQGRRPGGLGDMRSRALIPFLTKHIPGNPTFVAEYMPGGGGRKLANHLFTTARADGLTIGNVGSGFVVNAVLGEPGVLYDIDKLTYLGSGNSKTSYVLVTKKTSGINSLEKLRATPAFKIGTLSVGHDIYINARLFAWLIGLNQPVFVTGYSGPELDFALLRGEVQGRISNTGSLVTRNQDWIEKKLMDFHAIIEIPKGYRFRHPVFDPLPPLESFTQTKKEKKVLGMFRTFRLVGSPYILPPGVPRDRTNMLAEAFRNALNDPALPAAWKEFTGEDMAPLTPEEQDEAIKNIPRDRETVALFKKIAGGGPLPPR